MHQPILVYTRIEKNKRMTRVLLGSFAVVLLPVVSTCALFVLPFVGILAGYGAQAIWGDALHRQTYGVMLASSGGLGSPTFGDLPTSYLLFLGGTLIGSLAVVVFGLIAAAACLIDRFGSRMILRTADARPVTASEEPELVRVVDNLCIAAGLPPPALHVVESAAPNALATGPDPSRASLIVTRGLLTLLDRRELEAVVAHELSHIGNYDIRLSTTLAALVTIASLPLKVLAMFFRPRGRTKNLPVATAVGGAITAFIAIKVVATVGFYVGMFSVGAFAWMPSYVRWWNLHATIAPMYAVFLSPVFALLIRQAVYWEREFLADADATLLTRDPEALALALVKIGSAGGERLRVGEGVVHLYFVDPVSLGSLLHRLFPSHPPLAERIELLARMGSGIGHEALEAALEADAKARRPEPELEPVDGSAVEPEVPDEAPPTLFRPRKVLTPLYEKPDGWSTVLAQLPQDAQLTVIGTEGNFIRVRTGEHVLGYVARSAPLAALAAVRGSA